MIGQYYSHRKIGQFTSAWDAIQAYFYNVMIYTLNPSKWEHFSPVWCDWHEQMRAYAYIAADAPNYRYYIAAGTAHTILVSPEFYEEDSAGVPFVDWLRAMVENQGGTRGHGAMPWQNLECFVCDDPILCQ